MAVAAIIMTTTIPMVAGLILPSIRRDVARRVMVRV